MPHLPGFPGRSLLFGLQKRGGRAYFLPHHCTKLRAVPLQRRTCFSYPVELVRRAGEALPYKVKDR